MSEVYSPREDSFLLSECILAKDLSNKSCLDFGCGSGFLSVAMLKAGAKSVLSADISEEALAQTKINVNKFLGEAKKEGTQFPGHFLGVRKTSLFSSLPEKFDFIAFNPPYVPSDGIKWRDLDGGEKGRLVIDKFIFEVGNHLLPHGELFLLVSSLNGIGDVIGELKKKGFVVDVLKKKKLFFEELAVLSGVI